MLNSLTVFLIFLAFLAFGYASFLRLLARRHQSDSAGFFSSLLAGLTSNQLFNNLGSSAFFVGLPATALLLFWGWGPALIWLAVFHFFNDSLFHIQYSVNSRRACRSRTRCLHRKKHHCKRRTSQEHSCGPPHRCLF